ncbi:Tn7-like element transposition protein TnsE [Bacillus zhangzhouensis]|uniref:Tn7-like element transposition protein TnsE n=1 Tax=Bacillus zhangzhouensis TaxID=1178540 RepID=UPI003D22562C
MEREDRSLSILILSSNKIKEWNYIYKSLLLNLVNSSGVWSSQFLQNLENKGVNFRKMKHSKKNNRHRAELLLNKLI